MRITLIKNVDELPMARTGMSGASTEVAMENAEVISISFINSYGDRKWSRVMPWKNGKWLVIKAPGARPEDSYFWHTPGISWFRDESLSNGYMPLKTVRFKPGMLLAELPVITRIDYECIQANVFLTPANNGGQGYELNARKDNAHLHMGYVLRDREYKLSIPGLSRVGYQYTWNPLDSRIVFPRDYILLPEKE